MYDPKIVEPMREELRQMGVKELLNPEQVDSVMKHPKSGATMVVINSVCGCAAGALRPAIRLALKHSKIPAELYSVFAGQDKEATNHMRSYFHGFPPSSPSVVILKNGQVEKMLHRHEIEGKTADQIAKDITNTFDQIC